MTDDGLIFETLEEGTKTQHRLMRDGNLVSQLWIGDLTMRIGGSSVRMGGIGSVGTDRAHRNKGYARLLLEKCNDWMAENGYDCALLFGIANFYGKFGYAVCLPNCWYEIKTRHAERAARNLTERPFTPEDLPALQAIYASDSANLTGSLIRDANTPWFSNGYWGNVRRVASVFVKSDGEIVAYSARSNEAERVTICESGAARPEYFSDIIRSAAECAIEKRVEKITFEAPPESRLGHALALWGASQTLVFPQESDGMGRIIRLPSFFEKTLSEWTHRAKNAHELRKDCSLLLETDIGTVILRWDGEKMALSDSGEASGTIRLSQARLMQLAMGYHDSSTVLSLPDVDSEGDVRLCHALFPRRLGHMWQADHF